MPSAPLRRRALTVRGPFRGASGYDHHVREFARHLASLGVRLQLIDLPAWGPVKLAPALRDPWFETLARPVRSRAVLHFCMPHQVRRHPGQLNVNYTMFEATRIPLAWRLHNLTHDLVVLPAESSRQAWIASGFPGDRIRLCPLGVDADRFRPGLAPLPIADRRGRPVLDYRTRVLNVSELGPRKNLLGLLRTWIRATRAGDDAVLILKLSRGGAGWAVRLMRELAAVEQALGKTRAEAAPVVFHDALLPDADMPRLHATATHYWSMSHGEGWDLAMMEAAATGLALLAPAHSAYTTYLDGSSARLIPARLVPADCGRDGLGRLFQGAEWWEPDEEAAAEALREAIDGRDAGRPRARARVAESFTWAQAARRLLAVLEELHAGHGLPF
jgi:glycosyltransferase involved in cell wall biosynthesis